MATVSARPRAGAERRAEGRERRVEEDTRSTVKDVVGLVGKLGSASSPVPAGRPSPRPAPRLARRAPTSACGTPLHVGDNLDVLPRCARAGRSTSSTPTRPTTPATTSPYADRFRDGSHADPYAGRHAAWTRDDASAARGRARGAGPARRGVRQHRRQRGRPPAAADGRGLRRGQLPRPARSCVNPWARPGAASRAGSRPATSTSWRTPAPAVLRRRTAAPPRPSTSADFPLAAPTTGAASATCRCATPTRSSTRSPRRRSTSRCTVDPVTGSDSCRCSQRQAAAADARLRRRPAGGVAVVDGRGRRASRRPRVPGDPRAHAGSAPTSSSATGCTASGGRSREAAHDLAAEEIGSDRHRRRRAQAAGAATSSSRRSPPARPPHPGASARDVVVLDPFAGSGTTGHAVALANAADGGTGAASASTPPSPTRAGSNAGSPAADGRRHHPRPR